MKPAIVNGVTLENGHTGLPAESGYSSLIRFESVEECIGSMLARLAYRGNDKQVRILKLRHGLEGGRKWTLEEVGHELGVTRERVRQLQVKATRNLSRIATYIDSGPIDDCVKELRSFGNRVGEDLLNERFSQTLSAAVGIDQGRISAYISLLKPIIMGSDVERQSLDQVDLCLARALAERSGLVTVDDLHRIVLADPEACEAIADWPELDLSIRLQLVLYADIGADGFCSATEQTLLRWNSTDRRLFALNRVLREEGRPLHFTEIARRARPLLPGNLTMSDRNVHAWMDRYKDHFKWAGPGIFGLVEWDIGVREGSTEGDLSPARRLGIGDEIALLLSELNEPMSLSYIENHVLGRFEVGRGSVHASIVQDKAKRFVQLEDGMVALSSWYTSPSSPTVPGTKRRVRLPKELRDTARSAARRKASDVSDLIDQGTTGISPVKATGYAVLAAALGMTVELQMLLDIAGGGNMPTSMSDALRRFSES